MASVALGLLLSPTALLRRKHPLHPAL